MNDLISRQAAIDAIDAILPVEPMKNEYTQGITCGAALAIEYVKQLPSVQPEKRTEKRTETHACDLIDRQAAIDALNNILADYVPYLYGVTEAIPLDCAVTIQTLPSAQPEPQWIPCSERLPERIINGDVETVQEFFVTVKERWPGEEWKYHTDVAEFPGDYIDDVWQTYNDWKEGQEVHVIAWMPLPEPYREEGDK